MISLLLCVNTIFQSTKFLNKNFPGFLVYNNQIVSQFSLEGWALNVDKGIKSYDKIIKVNNVTVTDSRQIYEIVASKPEGTIFEYEVKRIDAKLSFLVPSSKFTLSHYFQIYIIEFLVGLIILGTGIFVFYLKPKLVTSKVLLLLCISLGNWFVNDFDYVTTYSVLYDFNISYFFQILTAASFILLALVFPEPKKIIKSKTWLFFIPLIYSFLLFITQFIFRYDSILWSQLDAIVWLSLAFATLFVVFFLIKSYSNASNILNKQRSKVALIGALLGFLSPAVMAVVFVFFEYENINMVTVPVLFFPVSLAYAIVKHKLFDIHTIAHKALVYGFSTGAVASIFIVPLFLINLVYSTENMLNNPLYLLVLSVALVIGINPLQNLIQNVC